MLMKLEVKINEDIKQAMRTRDARKLEALRAIKAALLLEKTGKDVHSAEIPESVEFKLLQKLVKQRRESAAIYTEQGRHEMAEEEIFQAEIIEKYLPQQMDEEEIRLMVKEIIEISNASNMKDMGRVMGMATKKAAGKADNALISKIVRETLG